MGVSGDLTLTSQRLYTCFRPNFDSSLPALNGFFNWEDTGIIVNSCGVVSFIAVWLIAVWLIAVSLSVVAFNAVAFSVVALSAV